MIKYIFILMVSLSCIGCAHPCRTKQRVEVLEEKVRQLESGRWHSIRIAIDSETKEPQYYYLEPVDINRELDKRF